MSVPNSQPTCRIPASFYRELVALRQLRDATQKYLNGYMLDEVESAENCLHTQQHEDAVAVSDALDHALSSTWQATFGPVAAGEPLDTGADIDLAPHELSLLEALSRTPQEGERVTAERMAAIVEVGHDRVGFAVRLSATKLR